MWPVLWDIYAALYRRYPDLSQEKIDWHWLRIMSNIDYDSVSWSFTCGDVVGVDSDGKACIGDDFVTKVLGVNVDRYAKMRLEVAMQHAVASGFNSNRVDIRDRLRKLYAAAWGGEEGFDEYMKRSFSSDGFDFGYADFAHQCATSASMYVDSRSIDSSFSGGSAERKQYAGWMGDCVLDGSGEGESTLGPDDYKSDLDADNISKEARSRRTSYQQASQKYYADIASGKMTRAQWFLDNNGGYENVVESIYEDLARKDFPATVHGMVRVPYADMYHIVQEGNGSSSPFMPFDYSAQEKADVIGRQRTLADTKSFLDALREGRNELPA